MGLERRVRPQNHLSIWSHRKRSWSRNHFARCWKTRWRVLMTKSANQTTLRLEQYLECPNMVLKLEDVYESVGLGWAAKPAKSRSTKRWFGVPGGRRFRPPRWWPLRSLYFFWPDFGFLAVACPNGSTSPKAFWAPQLSWQCWPFWSDSEHRRQSEMVQKARGYGSDLETRVCEWKYQPDLFVTSSWFLEFVYLGICFLRTW